MANNASSICKFHKYGYCKKREDCDKIHPEENCHDKTCDVNKCRKRHPKTCQNFWNYGQCIFGSECHYSHSETRKDVNNVNDIEKELSNVKKLCKENNVLIKDILDKLEKLENIASTTNHNEVDSKSIDSDKSLLQCNECDGRYTSKKGLQMHKRLKHIQGIMQLDGNISMCEINASSDEMETENNWDNTEKSVTLESEMVHNDLCEKVKDDDPKHTFIDIKIRASSYEAATEVVNSNLDKLVDLKLDLSSFVDKDTPKKNNKAAYVFYSQEIEHIASKLDVKTVRRNWVNGPDTEVIFLRLIHPDIIPDPPNVPSIS